MIDVLYYIAWVGWSWVRKIGLGFKKQKCENWETRGYISIANALTKDKEGNESHLLRAWHYTFAAPFAKTVLRCQRRRQPL